MGVGAGLYMYVVVVQKFTFAISSPDEFLSSNLICMYNISVKLQMNYACERLSRGRSPLDL